MRDRYTLDNQGRVTAGANIKVLNNSWGQPAGYDQSLEASIRDSNDRGILFVAAAGNGNVLGQGVDNDRTPFYPASYDSLNVIAVAAMDHSNRPAQFSNFGAKSVDIFAPGVGIRSTLRGNAYGTATGTSMARHNVAGSAALIWSAYPEASVAEVRQAILSTATPVSALSGLVATGGRLNASAAINADVFAPAARLVSKQDITTAGGATTEFTVEYYHRTGIDASTLGNDDIQISRSWGSSEVLSASLKPGSINSQATSTTATYILNAPGGTWDVLDYGTYSIFTNVGAVRALASSRTTETRLIGNLQVRIDDPSVIYVSSAIDSIDPGSLRAAIMQANAVAPSPRTIILNPGTYSISIAPQVDPNSTFPDPAALSQIVPANYSRGWSGPDTGDFDVTGNVSIYGDQFATTTISANGLDRVFKVHPGHRSPLKADDTGWRIGAGARRGWHSVGWHSQRVA